MDGEAGGPRTSYVFLISWVPNKEIPYYFGNAWWNENVKILHYVGYPLAWAQGGHAVQIRQTIAALEELGVQNEWLDPARPTAQPGDILHYWGIGMQNEAFEIFKRNFFDYIQTFKDFTLKKLLKILLIFRWFRGVPCTHYELLVRVH